MAVASNKKACVVCGKEKFTNRDFYISHSRVWGKLDGKMPVCKECVIDLYDYYQKERRLGMRATIISICRKLDIYFSDELYNTTLEDAKKKTEVPVINLYIGKLNIALGNSKDSKSFEDSELKELGESNFKTVNNDGMDITPEERAKLVRFWGRDVFETEEDLLRLQDTYEDFLSSYPSDDYVKREYFKMLAIEYLRLSKTKNAKDRKDITSVITTLTDKANLSPKDTEQNKQEDDYKLLSMMVKKIESEEPVDYGVTEKALYKDYRGYKKYIEEYLVKPMKKAFNFE